VIEALQQSSQHSACRTPARASGHRSGVLVTGLTGLRAINHDIGYSAFNRNTRGMLITPPAMPNATSCRITMAVVSPAVCATSGVRNPVSDYKVCRYTATIDSSSTYNSQDWTDCVHAGNIILGGTSTVDVSSLLPVWQSATERGLILLPASGVASESIRCPSSINFDFWL
jgi:hypothetical protein